MAPSGFVRTASGFVSVAIFVASIARARDRMRLRRISGGQVAITHRNCDVSPAHA